MSDNVLKVITPIARLSYPFLGKPQQPSQPGKPAKYSCSLIFAPGTDLSALRRALEAAIEAKWPGKTKDPKFMAGLHKPLRDAPDDVLAKGYPEGSTFINVRSNNPPGLVYPWPAEPGSKVPMVVPPEKVEETFYPGCYVIASISAYGFEAEGKKGPTFGLNNLQWIKDGDRLDNRKKATEEFVADMAAAPADLSDLLGK